MHIVCVYVNNKFKRNRQEKKNTFYSKLRHIDGLSVCFDLFNNMFNRFYYFYFCCCNFVLQK